MMLHSRVQHFVILWPADGIAANYKSLAGMVHLPYDKVFLSVIITSLGGEVQ